MPLRDRLAVRITTLLCVAVLACPALAQGWEASDLHLTMQPPEQWQTFEPPLLTYANAHVRHITGKGFIAGHGLRTTDGSTLIFPYALIQYQAYDTLPEAHRPAARLDERGRLMLMVRVLDGFKLNSPLPATIDTAAFAERYSNKYVRLVGFTEDGRFDLTGEIPNETNEDPIRYHTHGVLGKSGVAMVTLFAGEQFDEMGPVISGPLRTLAFEAGHAYRDLPEQPPTPPEGEATSGDGTPGAGAPERSETGPPPDEATSNDRNAGTASTADGAADPPDKAANAPAVERDTSTMYILLGVLGGVLVVVALVVGLVTHKQAEARRERARARRERLHQRAQT